MISAGSSPAAIQQHHCNTLWRRGVSPSIALLRKREINHRATEGTEKAEGKRKGPSAALGVSDLKQSRN